MIGVLLHQIHTYMKIFKGEKFQCFCGFIASVKVYHETFSASLHIPNGVQ